MIVATLERYNTEHNQTIGKLSAVSPKLSFLCKTIELPDAGNQPNISCIPKGTYICKYTFSLTKIGWSYEVQNVPKRSGIRLHSANYSFQLKGCIALGSNAVDINSDGALDVINSKATIAKLVTFMNKQPFYLVIK